MNKENEYVWQSNVGDVYIQDMETNHIRNTLIMINNMMDKGKIDDYPVQYDNLFNELASRGEDTDFELDDIYKSL